MNIGILSTSSIAPRFIAAVREEGSFEITALSSRTLEKAREKAQIPARRQGFGISVLRREIEKRNEGRRLTASADLHG